MKKSMIYGFVLFGLLSGATSAGAQKAFPTINNRPVERHAVSTTLSALNVNLESPFRCKVKEFGDIEVMTTLSLKSGDFQLKSAVQSDALPRYEVNGFSFPTMPVDEALQRLVDEAGISVYTQGGAYPELNASDLYGELEPVLTELSRAGEVFYQYDATRKQLHLSRKGQFVLQLPQNRWVMFAVLDALRGAGITTAEPDWKKATVNLTLTRAQEEQVNRLMGYILKDSKLLVADTQVYALTPNGQADWQDVITRFGPGRIYTAKNGLMGKLLTTGHKNHTEDLLAALSPSYQAALVSEGVAIVPHGWKMRFDVGRCATTAQNVNELSVLLNSNIKNPKEVETTVSLDTPSGEITSFDVWTEIDNELAIIGIPGRVAGLGINGEILVTLKLRFIRLIPEGK
ncbi:MAG: hypothetical protein ACI4QM_03020 [Alphaproteobacteria bacterium]